MPLSALTFIFAILAAYRVTRFIVADSLIERPRVAVTDWLDRHHAGHLGDLINCQFCAGFWVCTLLYLALDSVGLVGDAPLLVHAVAVWAIAGGQAVLGAAEASLTSWADELQHGD